MRYIPSSKNIHKVLISKGLIRREATRSTTDGLSLYRAKRSKWSSYLFLMPSFLAMSSGRAERWSTMFIVLPLTKLYEAYQMPL